MIIFDRSRFGKKKFSSVDCHLRLVVRRKDVILLIKDRDFTHLAEPSTREHSSRMSHLLAGSVDRAMLRPKAFYFFYYAATSCLMPFIALYYAGKNGEERGDEQLVTRNR